MNRLRNRGIALFVVCCFISLVTGCGSGGEQAVVKTLEKQNQAAEECFTKLQDLLQSTIELQEDLAGIDSGDTAAQDAAVQTVKTVLVPLAAEAYAAADRIFEAESDLQNLINPAAQIFINPVRDPRALALPLVLTICVGVLSFAALYTDLSENHVTYMEEWERCGDVRKAAIDAIPKEWPGEKRQEEFELIWADYEACMQSAENAANWDDTLATLAYLLPEGGSSEVFMGSRTGRIFFQSIGSATDTTGLYIMLTNPEVQDEQKREVNAPVADVHDRAAAAKTNFIFARSNSAGEVIAPVGQWNMAVFKPGYLRSGTPAGEMVQVLDNQTTEVNFDPVPVSQVTTADLVSCGTGIDDNETDGDDNATDDNETVAPEKGWMLVDTQVNPNDVPLEYYGGGGTPGWFDEPRFEGKSQIYTVSETSFSVHDVEMDHGYLYYDVTLTTNFEAPPAKLIPGETVSLEASCSHSGQVNDAWSPSLLFQYQGEGVSISPSSAFWYAPWNEAFDGENSATYSFTVPNTGSGQITISSFWWNAGMALVVWTYEAE
jgi:hypothetical protein